MTGDKKKKKVNMPPKQKEHLGDESSAAPSIGSKSEATEGSSTQGKRVSKKVAKKRKSTDKPIHGKDQGGEAQPAAEATKAKKGITEQKTKEKTSKDAKTKEQKPVKEKDAKASKTKEKNVKELSTEEKNASEKNVEEVTSEEKDAPKEVSTEEKDTPSSEQEKEINTAEHEDENAPTIQVTQSEETEEVEIVFEPMTEEDEVTEEEIIDDEDVVEVEVLEENEENEATQQNRASETGQETERQDTSQQQETKSDTTGQQAGELKAMEQQMAVANEATGESAEQKQAAELDESERSIRTSELQESGATSYDESTVETQGSSQHKRRSRPSGHRRKSHHRRKSDQDGSEPRRRRSRRSRSRKSHPEADQTGEGSDAPISDMEKKKKRRSSKHRRRRRSDRENGANDHIHHQKYYKTIEDIEKQIEIPASEASLPYSEQPNSYAADIESGMDNSLAKINDDPFALREGKTLLWREVNMVLKGKKNEADRMLLDNVWGEVPEKQTTAIMGPSGAGKTSLLNILAGRATSRGRVTISSDVRLNNFAVDPADINVRKHIAFVAQDDSLQVTSTPREAIYFSAKLRLPRSTTEESLTKLVNQMLLELGLTNCADTFVGGALLKGISGGERKRTSVGVELVVKPAMVFLDEPTSGLDSFSAVQLCQVLKKVANAGSSVLFTIHQPASEIFNSFDRLILLNKGRVMFQGLVNEVPRYFKSRGHPCPPNYNPADWIMNVAQSVPLEVLDQAGFFPRDSRNLPDAFTDHVDGKDELGITLTEHHMQENFDETPVGMGTQAAMLFARELRNFRRDTIAIGARFGLSVFLSILVGSIFNGVAEADSAISGNLNSHFGAMIMVLLMSMFGTAQPALLAFPEERPVFLREYSTNHYSVFSYFMARLTMEAFVTALQILVQVLFTYFMIKFRMSFLMMFCIVYALAMSSTALAVMLGCAVEDPKLGQEMLPILFVPQMLFAGFFVVPELIPVWLRWARFLCSLTYGVRIALVEEFGNGCGNPKADENCANLLRAIDADEDAVWWNWIVLACLFVFFRLIGLFILQRKAVKFF